MKKTAIIFFLIMATFFLPSCNKAPVERSEFLLDTYVQIKIYSGGGEKELEKAFELCEKYENMLSKTIEQSDIYKITSSAPDFVEVNDETVELLEKAIYYGDLSEGKFDVTIGEVVDLWDFKSDARTLPDKKRIDDIIKYVDYNNIEVDGNKVRLLETEAKLDLGGIAKGFIGDKIAELLEQEGVTAALINLGGNVITLGEKPDKEKWNVAIHTPFGEAGDNAALLKVGAKSVVSSGVYERYFEHEGHIYHHILDTETGYPVDNDLLSVTIISNKSVDGDALSTIVFGAGVEKGLKIIETLDDVEGVFLTKEKKIYCSEGINKDIEMEILDTDYELVGKK